MFSKQDYCYSVPKQVYIYIYEIFFEVTCGGVIEYSSKVSLGGQGKQKEEEKKKEKEKKRLCYDPVTIGEVKNKRTGEKL